MYNIVKSYISIMKKEDILNYAIKHNLKVSEEELDFIYNFIKNNYEYYLKNPKNFNIEDYKDKFSKENYIFISNLINQYKRMI